MDTQQRQHQEKAAAKVFGKSEHHAHGTEASEPCRWACKALLGPTPHSSASMGPLPGRSRHSCVHLGTPAATPPAPLVCCCPLSLHILCSNVGYQLRVQACGMTTKPQLVGAHSALCSAVPQNQACQLSPDPSPKDGAESWCPCV